MMDRTLLVNMRGTLLVNMRGAAELLAKERLEPGTVERIHGRIRWHRLRGNFPAPVIDPAGARSPLWTVSSVRAWGVERRRQRREELGL